MVVSKNKNLKLKRILLTALAICILIAGASLLYWYLSREDSKNSLSNGSADNNGVDMYSPPTNEEKIAGDEQKKQNEEDENRRNGQSVGSTSVIITDAGQYNDVIEVRAFMPDHYQDGTCTFIITKDAYNVSKSTPGYRDVSTTICTNPLFSRSEFATAGEWQVIVEYSADGAKGTSEPKNITIN